MHRAVFVLTAAIAVHGVASAQQVRPCYWGANTHYQKAKASFEKKDLKAARKHLEASLELCPDFAPAHFLKAKVHYAGRDFTKALDEILLAKAAREAAMAFWERVQAEQRAAASRQIRQVVASDVPGYGNEAVSESVSSSSAYGGGELPKPGGAVPEYSFVHGNVLLRLGERAEAAAQYAEALRLRPDYREAANNLVSVYLLTGQSDEARAVIGKGEVNGLTFSPELRKAVEDGRPGHDEKEGEQR